MDARADRTYSIRVFLYPLVIRLGRTKTATAAGCLPLAYLSPGQGCLNNAIYFGGKYAYSSELVVCQCRGTGLLAIFQFRFIYTKNGMYIE